MCYNLSYRCSYNRWLCRARAEDLSDIAALKALYQTGEFSVCLYVKSFFQLIEHSIRG